MMAKRFIKLAAVAVAASALGVVPSTRVAADTAQLITVVGGASGMNIQLNYSSGIVRGCAPRIMDRVILDANSETGTVKHAYSSARIQSGEGDQWSEPNVDNAFGTNPVTGNPQVKFSGDKSDLEIQYMRVTDANSPYHGKVVYAITASKDSVTGHRFVSNRQAISGFVAQSGAPSGRVFIDATGADVTSDADFQDVLTDIAARAANKPGGLQSRTTTYPTWIPIEGGLTECYQDSAWRAIDEWNNDFASGRGELAQPQMNPAHFQKAADPTNENALAVAVLAVIYNKNLTSQTLNVTQQMERLITGGYIDNWAFFFTNIDGMGNPLDVKLLNYYREPLSGTCVTYKNLIMRGMKQKPNTTFIGTNSGDGGFMCGTTNYNGSGIPGIECMTALNAGGTGCPDGKVGGGAVNKGVNNNQGGHGYTFLQRFTTVVGTTPSSVANIRVAKVNGYEPYTFSPNNSLPGCNGVADVDTGAPGYFQNVIDGKYPLWTYDHCYALPGQYQIKDANGQAISGLQSVVSQGLANFVAYFYSSSPQVQADVRSVGLIPVTDMDSQRQNIPAPTNGRGKGLARCGFYSPITGEIVRDGMAMMQNDDNGGINKLPGEPYVEMRP